MILASWRHINCVDSLSTVYGGFTTNMRPARVCARARVRISTVVSAPGARSLSLLPGVLPASVPLFCSILVPPPPIPATSLAVGGFCFCFYFDRYFFTFFFHIFSSANRDREGAQMRIGLRIFESSQLHRGQSS